MPPICTYSKVAKVVIFIALAFFFTSCNPTKYVPEGDYLLADERLELSGKGMKKSDFEPLIRQQPNRTIFRIFRFNLWFYNRSSEKNSWFNRWLRSVGEPPVIFDSSQMVLSTTRMQQYANRRGYYGSHAKDTVVYEKNKAYVTYSVQLAQPYHIRSIRYDIMDKTLDTSFILDPKKRLIQVGNIFDGEVLVAESERIAAEMRNRGYYMFNDSYVNYGADTTVGGRGVNLTLRLHKEPTGSGNKTRNHRLFYVESLVVNPEYSPEDALGDDSYSVGWDTIREHGFELLCNGCDKPDVKPYVRPELLAISNRIRLDSLYSEQEVNRTYANLANLRLFKSINIRFDEPRSESLLHDSLWHPLTGSIILSPFKRQNYTWGGEVSLSVSPNGNLLFGTQGTLGYQHKNLFRGAEILDVGLRASFQKVQMYADSAPENAYELGATVSLSIPQFLMPVPFSFYRNVFSPRTQISVSGDFQRRPDYTRVLSAFTFGYSWRNLGAMTYIYNPVDMNIINMVKVNLKFLETISKNPYLLSAYQPAFLLGSSFSILYNNRAFNRRRQVNIRGDVELKGNLLWLGYTLAGATPVYDLETDRSSYEVMGTEFSQFAKFDLSYSSLHVLNASNSIAWRALGGIGIPYANSISLPFDKMYYAGGANGLRGWQIRTLGPGSYAGDSAKSTYNRLADMRLEVNFEYRFKFFWRLEGALFVDAGNIWSIQGENPRQETVFKLRDFPKQVAIDWGLGLRLNFTVLVIRLDYGIKLHDPAVTDRYFVQPRSWFSRGNNSVFIALGYPF